MNITNFLNILTIDKPLKQLSYNNHRKTVSVPKHVALMDYLLFSIGFYGICLYVFFKIIKNGIEEYKKEICIILLVYIPGLIYGVLGISGFQHYWYLYIYIIPLTIISAKFLTLIVQYLKSRTIKISFYALVASLFIYFNYFTYRSFRDL